MLNEVVASAIGLLLEDGSVLPQVTDINHGMVTYVDRTDHRANEVHLPNPIVYSYLKDRRFGEENELRVTLSASGAFAAYGFSDARRVDFPSGLQLPFDFRKAMDRLAIVKIRTDPAKDPQPLLSELKQRSIRPFAEYQG